MTDKEHIEKLEEAVALCQLAIERILDELFVLQQKTQPVKPDWKEYLKMGKQMSHGKKTQHGQGW